MTTNVDIANRALITAGLQKQITAVTQDSVEAKAFAAIYQPYRDQLLRMAPWNCGLVYSNLVYLSSVPGTPENTSAATSLWTPGQPAPPWAYEYMLPDDCLRMCFLIPANQTGFADGIPITTAVTGGAPAFWQGQPVKFKESVDQYFRQASGSVTIVSGGTGHAVGDVLICGGAPSVAGDVPAGLINITVSTVTGGVITAATLTNFTNLGKNSLLYSTPAYNLNQVVSTGIGTGAVVSVAAVEATQFPARVILTNQEYATCAYVKQITDPNVMDPQFVEAWINVCAAGIAMTISGDKQIAGMLIKQANDRIMEARKTDGNEGLSINDVTPDFIRVRGIAWTEYYQGPWANFDWGSFWPVY